MIDVTLTPTEHRVLITHSKQGANDLIRSRALALLMHAAGQSCSGIAAVVDYHVTTVRGWLRAFERTRVSSIFPHYAANQNAAKLTRAQKEEIALHPPDPRRIAGRVVDAPSVDRVYPRRIWGRL